MPGIHASNSPSTLHKRLGCPGSAYLETFFDNEETSYAKAGTEAHSLCAYKTELKLGREPQNCVNVDDFEYYDGEMDDYAESYSDYIVSIVEELKRDGKHPVCLIEHKFEIEGIASCYGTADCVIIADDILIVIDYKNGKGVLVSAERNPQFMAYGIGAYETLSPIYDNIKTVRLVVYQPAKYNISSFDMSVNELLEWKNKTLLPTLKKIDEGYTEYHEGTWCTFCRAKDRCRPRYEQLYKDREKVIDKEPNLIGDEELGEWIRKAERVSSWADKVKEYALKIALDGAVIPGYKLVEGRSVRKFTDKETVAKLLKKSGIDPWKPKELKGLTDIKKLMHGEKKMYELLGEFIYKPEGKPVLVEESDSREEMVLRNTAAEAFADDNVDD